MGDDFKGMGSFGAWLKCTLEEAGLKQRDLAKMMHITEACVSRWVHGNRIPAPKQMAWILQHFSCHIEIVPNGWQRPL